MMYYVDSLRGNDRNDGNSPETAWRTLERASQCAYAPGDGIRLRRGCFFAGCLAPRGSGEDGRVCSIEPYGEGEPPRLDAKGQSPAAISLFNAQFWEIRGLDIANQGDARAVHRCGIECALDDFGTARHIVIEDNFIHDVNGSNVKKDGDRACGIRVSASGAQRPSRFDGVYIRRNRLERCDRVGIYVRGMGARDRWNPMRDVWIHANHLRNIGGDGILNIGTTHCRVSCNTLIAGRMRDDMYCAGIWPWSSDYTLIERNEVSGYRGTRDGQGFDCDYNCVGTTHRLNYSHDNEGGYMLVCTAAQKRQLPRDVGCFSSRIEHNLSVNDLCRTFHLAGPIVGTAIHDNCVYVGPGIDIPCVLATGEAEPMGGPLDTLIFNNVFAARGRLRFSRSIERLEDGTFRSVDDPAIAGLIFFANAYLGNFAARPEEAAPPAHSGVRLEALEEILLDGAGQARPGIQTLYDYLAYTGTPIPPMDE